MDFLETHYLYLGLMIFSMAYPIAQSFGWRLQYYQKWKYLFPAILLMCSVFIPWDIWFTSRGIWWFNDRYISGVRILHLPVEEWLFFLVVPFACVFIYEVLNYYVRKDFLKPVANPLFSALILCLIILSVRYSDRLYPFVTFTLTAGLLALTIFFNPAWKGRFLLMYLVSWLPFLLVNGVLTGNFTEGAVVNYNAQEFIGIRITTIPVEDSVYSLAMLLMVIATYETLQNKIWRPHGIPR